jgi:hypothetical protein
VLPIFVATRNFLFIFIIRHSDNFSLFNLVIESICYELLLTVYSAVLHSVRVRTIYVPSPGWEQRTNLTDIRPIETPSHDTASVYKVSKVQVTKGTPLVKVFEILSRNGFHGLKMGFSCSEGTI